MAKSDGSAAPGSPHEPQERCIMPPCTTAPHLLSHFLRLVSLSITLVVLIYSTGRAQPATLAADTLFISPTDTLAGPLPSHIDKRSRPYWVSADIVVPQGKTVTIEAGTILLFSNFTGLKIQGTLLARGNADNPIVFTSVNDTLYNRTSTITPAPYDWNGIDIFETGIGTTLVHCKIFYSVYGINSLTRYVRISPALFRNNGRADLTIEGTPHRVGETPYEYALNADEAHPRGAPLTLLPDPLANKRSLARYSGLSTCVGGFAIAIISTIRFGSSAQAFKQISSTEAHNLAANSSEQWQSRRSQARKDLLLMSGGYVLGIAGAVGLTWSFTF
jgi:hypothetical protein